MPKLKTNKSVKGRFKVTGRGKLVHTKPFGSHLLSGKTSKRKMKIRKDAVLSEVEARRMRRLLPYD